MELQLFSPVQLAVNQSQVGPLALELELNLVSGILDWERESVIAGWVDFKPLPPLHHHSSRPSICTYAYVLHTAKVVAYIAEARARALFLSIFVHRAWTACVWVTGLWVKCVYSTSVYLHWTLGITFTCYVAIEKPQKHRVLFYSTSLIYCHLLLLQWYCRFVLLNTHHCTFVWQTARLPRHIIILLYYIWCRFISLYLEDFQFQFNFNTFLR